MQDSGSNDEHAIALRALSKEYPGYNGQAAKCAVDNLTLGVGYGECLGLLGPNGAGKTTTMNMMSGCSNPTSGEAFVGGHSLTEDLRNVLQVLGVCPQFDTVWESLSVRAHLLLYVRLKGTPIEREQLVVQQVAESVGLDGDELNQPASALSGGMKRRLSLGIALCGDPEVLFLDEPTTGLDPETRQGVWRVIEAAKRERCIVLTTHSMEEADALCTRIGIMANGALQCLGTQLHLKNKYGSGFELKLGLSHEADSWSIDRWITSLTLTLTPTLTLIGLSIGGSLRSSRGLTSPHEAASAAHYS